MVAPNIEALSEALTSSLDSIQNFFDKGTGEVIAISDEFGPAELDGPPDRYLAITPLTASERFQIMEDFTESLSNPPLQEELNDALIGREAFLRFEDVLRKYPDQLREWEAFRKAVVIDRVRTWLSQHGIALEA